MKKIIFCIYCIFCLTTIGFSQSKEESERWILTKLNIYTANHDEVFWRNDLFYTSHRDKDFKFSFETIEGVRFLIIVYTRSYYHYDINQKLENITSEERNVFIPIYAINNIEALDHTGSTIYKNVNVATDVMRLSINKGSYEKSKGGILYPITSFELTVITDIEDNIIERINKAFLHLKTFFKEPEKLYKREPF